MHVLQDNFYYSNSRLGADGGLEDERQLLVEEQKLCRARARKISLETNRRRKILDERRKLWDVQAQRLRENILQQRRQRIQDATERFQRAHLPPQRCRQSFRNVPNIEEAFSLIQDTFSSHTQQSSFLSGNSNISSCTSSPKPPTVSKSSHHQALSAVEAYTKLLQEHSMTCFKNNEETEKIQEKQQDDILQDSHLSDCCNSESLSSKDSLENEDTNYSTKNLQCSCSSFLLDSEESHPVLKNQKDLYPSDQILLPAKNGNNKDILFGSNQKPNIFLKDSTYNASQEAALQQTGKETHCMSSQKQLSDSINNLNKVLNSESKTEKPISTALLQHTRLSNIQSDSLNCLNCPEEEAQKLPISVATSHSVCKVRFIKGILKKQSKYKSEATTCVYGTGHLIFAKQVALKIRDSVELTRAKAIDAEANKTVKKKLHWFDEVQVGKEDKEQNIIKQMKGKSSRLSPSRSNSVDHQLSVTTVSGAYRPGPIMTPAAPTGYHFTKQAWADVGVQVSLPQEQEDEVKLPQSSTRTSGRKVPQRERSTKVGVGPVSTRTRKGTVIRPQSAIEVSQLAKTQGKSMVPRPPPRLEEKTAHVTKTPYGMDRASVNCKQVLAVEQVLRRDNSEGFLSPSTHHGIRTDSTVMYTPLPSSYTFPASEDTTKGTPSSGHQETHNCSRRRGMVFSEKGFCLDCTPTDEEISQLWDGVRHALATKDAEAMLARQNLESERVVRKPFVKQSRHPSGLGNRTLPQPSQPAKRTTEPVRQFSTYGVGFPDEGIGLQSAARLHMAEVPAEGLLEERDIVGAMEIAQTQRPGTVQQCSQKQGLTSISLEEQKILLSLDRLNNQLQCVQEHVKGKTGTRNMVLIDAPSTKEVKVTTHHKHRASSASKRSQIKKKI